jgi:hypothetical protein
MWPDGHRGEDDHDADLDAQQRSPGDAFPKNSGMSAMHIAAEMPPIAPRL